MAIVALCGAMGMPGFVLWAAIAIACAAFSSPGRSAASESRGDRNRAARQRSGIAEAVLAHIPDPVILVDQRAVVIEANEAATVSCCRA